MHQRRHIASSNSTPCPEESRTIQNHGNSLYVHQDGSVSKSTMPRSQTEQRQQQERRRRRRKRRNGKGSDDLTCIFVGMGVVCIGILVALGIVLRLIQSPSSSSPHATSSSSKKSLLDFGDRFRTKSMLGHKTTLDGSNDDDSDDRFPELPSSPIYTIPNSMPHIGDRSDFYATLRKKYDAEFPYNPTRSLQFVKDNILGMHSGTADTTTTTTTTTTFTEDLEYDIYNCPDIPPPNYPQEWKTLDVLNHWSPEETRNIPNKVHQGLCVFDYQRDHVRALTYRNAEVPFIVRGDPDVAAVVERWNVNDASYLDQLMEKVPHRAEISQSNHFMYWVPSDATRKRRGNPPQSKEPEGWTAPTKMIRMTYEKFKQEAIQPREHNDTHWYFRLIGCGETGPKGDCDAGASEWLFDELTFFQPRSNLLYLKDPTKQRGIHCRFGMEGVTIANHFDQSRNAIALLGGQRRYILSHPKNCRNLCLYPKGHPSARHSAMDWSKPDLDRFPEFGDAMSNEVLLEAGDVLYLPTNWFHYIVNLGVNFQCNTRSGTSQDAMAPIRACGF